jgi:hypothetical protein
MVPLTCQKIQRVLQPLPLPRRPKLADDHDPRPRFRQVAHRGQRGPKARIVREDLLPALVDADVDIPVAAHHDESTSEALGGEGAEPLDTSVVNGAEGRGVVLVAAREKGGAFVLRKSVRREEVLLIEVLERESAESGSGPCFLKRVFL